MTTDESLALFGLVPQDKHLMAIRTLLEGEVKKERGELGELSRVDDLALLCCVQLFSRGKLEDVLRIWDAKETSMDLACTIDVQFLCGAGLDLTKSYLEVHPSAAAAKALAYLNQCEDDFDDFTPQGYLEHCRACFASDFNESDGD